MVNARSVEEARYGDLGVAASAALRSKYEECRTSFHPFVEFVMRDEEGFSLKQATIHRLWHLHAEWCWKVGRIPAILAPFGHGKTSQMTIGRTAFEIGQDVNARTKIVCQNDQKAMERVMGISAMISSARYRAVFPGVRPVSNQKASKAKIQSKWTQHEVFLDRPGFSIDPSIQAAGVLSAGTGGRADLLVFDDVVDQRNAIDEPALRQKIIDNIDNVWMHRLEPSGRVLFIGTPWHQADFTHVILNRPAWCVLRQWISEDFKRVEQEVYNAPDGYPIPSAIRGPSLALARLVVEDSTNVREIVYDPNAEALEVMFRSGSRYAYKGVPSDVHAAFQASTSKGSFFAQVIRNRYPATRIGES